VQSISDVHAILYKTGAVEAVKFDAYLGELCRRLGNAGADRGVAIELEAAPLEVPSEDAVQLGIVVNELITNAVKHAYPPPHKGKIIVKLSAADDEIRLSVRDFGPGLAADGRGPSGLGMRLVRSLVEKRGGAVTLESGDGLEVQVTLPDRRGEAGEVRLS
jgi:two-component sensor histidine kinase